MLEPALQPRPDLRPIRAQCFGLRLLGASEPAGSGVAPPADRWSGGLLHTIPLLLHRTATFVAKKVLTTFGPIHRAAIWLPYTE